MPARETPTAQKVLEATGSSAHAECLFCGQQNPIGLKLTFHARDDGSVQAVSTCERLLQGYPGTLHGGVVSALLDSAMTNCLFSRGIVAVTAELTVRFLSPVRLDHPAEVTAAVTRVRGPLYYLQAELTQGQTLTARAQATFVKKDQAGFRKGHRGGGQVWAAGGESQGESQTRRVGHMNLEECKVTFHARTEQYRRLGYDRFAAARFIAEAAGDLEGPVLDVGTGKGLLAMALARGGLDVVSVDVNAEDSELAAALARDAGLDGHIRFLLQDARFLPFPDGCFGCAAMMEVLHHLDDARSVLAEMVRLVRPNGVIIVADFTEAGFAMIDSVHRADGQVHPRSSVTLPDAREFLASLGWREEGRAEAHHNAVVWFRRTKAPSS